ncbi:MAG TPA: hypothetical protein VHS59_10370 [Bacillota bacterium]|nr:hypothetical protein [Bacillota bacterium]
MQNAWKEYSLDESSKPGLSRHLLRLKVFRPEDKGGKPSLEEWRFYQVSGEGKAGLQRASRNLDLEAWVFRITCGSKTGFYYDMECQGDFLKGITKFRSFHQAEQKALTLAKKHLLQQEGAASKEENQLALANRIQKYR